MSKHSRANVRHEIAQQDRREAKRSTAKPKPIPLCRGCKAAGKRTVAVYALMGDRLNCCQDCWERAEGRNPFAAIVALAHYDGLRRPSGPTELARKPCLHCHRALMSDEDWSDQTALYGRFTGVCEACFRSPSLSHDEILSYMGRTA
jgi:hypothetical protein